MKFWDWKVETIRLKSKSRDDKLNLGETSRKVRNLILNAGCKFKFPRYLTENLRLK